MFTVRVSSGGDSDSGQSDLAGSLQQSGGMQSHGQLPRQWSQPPTSSGKVDTSSEKATSLAL